MTFLSVYADDKVSLAVFDFNVVGLDDEMGVIPADFFRSYLFKTGKFNLVSRESMQVIMDEMKLQESGCTSEECFVKLGQILLARYVLTGKLYKLEETYFLTVSLISVEDAVILYSDKSKIEDIYNIDMVCGRMIEKMIQALFNVTQQVVEVYDSDSLRYKDKEGRVIKVIDPKTIVIDKGLKHGLSAEMHLFLFHDKEKYAIFKIYEVNRNSSKAYLYTRLKKGSPSEGDLYTAPYSPTPWDILPKSYANIRMDAMGMLSGIFELRRPFPRQKQISFFCEAKVSLGLRYRHILFGTRLYLSPVVYAAALCKYSDISYPISGNNDRYSWTGSSYQWYERDAYETRGRSTNFAPGFEFGVKLFSSNDISFDLGLRYLFVNTGIKSSSEYYKEYYDELGELDFRDLDSKIDIEYGQIAVFMGIVFKI